MDDPDHKDILIQQLKDIVRTNEEILKKKEKELEESHSKFQKLKLQSKAKIAQLASQVKTQHEASPEGELAGGEDGSKPATPHHEGDAAAKGRLRMLKHQLDETKQQLQKKEREMEASRKSFEATVEQLQKQLLQRDEALMEASDNQVAKQQEPSGGQRQDDDSGWGSNSSSKEEERMYAQMVYKDSKILELNNQILELERRILDLQENLREKDQVLQARSRAIQLMTEDLSLRNKTTVDDLDDTRAEMRLMQQYFLEQETSWKQREATLSADLDSNKGRVSELEESFRRLESTRFQLAAHNAELQEKVVRLQEAAEKARTEQAATFQAKLDSLSKELDEKTAALEEAQKTLQESTRETEAKVLKARALERRRAKHIERELKELKEHKKESPAPESSDITTLQQQIAELEEEKGALQLKLLEMEDTLSAQASKLEETTSKDKATIEELKAEVKAARDEKISLEVQAAQLEEQRELEEQRIQELQQELKALRAASEDSTPALQEELKTALEEEVQKLNARHEQDSSTISELQQELKQTQEKLTSATMRADELDSNLQTALRNLEETTLKLEDSNRARDQGESETVSKLGKIQELEIALREAQERLEESTLKTEQSEQTCRELRERLEASVEEAAQLRTSSKEDSEALRADLQRTLDNLRAAESKWEQADLAVRAMQEECRLKASQVEELTSAYTATLDMLNRHLEDVNRLEAELGGLRDKLKAKQREIDEVSSRETELRSELVAINGNHKATSAAVTNLLKHFGVPTLEEVKVAWDRERSEKEQVSAVFQKELHEATLKNEQLARKVEELEDTLKEADSLRAQLAAMNDCLESLAVGSLEELKSKWNALQENLTLLSQSQKLDKEELNNRIKELVDEKTELQRVTDTKEYQVSALMAEVDKLKLASDEAGSLLAERDSALQEALHRAEELQSCLHAERLKTESKVATLLEQCTDLEKEVSALQSEVEDKERSLLELREHVSSKETELQNSAERFACQEAALQELLQELQEQVKTSQDGLSEATREATSLRETIRVKDEEVSVLRTELAGLTSNFENAAAENKSLTNKLKKVQKKVEALNSKCKEAESSRQAAQQELDAAVSAKMELESSCFTLREQLAQVEDEKLGVNKQLLEAATKVEELRSQLSNLECAQQGKESEMYDTVKKLQDEKVDISSRLHQVEETLALTQKEKEDLSLKISRMQEQLDQATQSCKQLEEHCNHITEELARQTEVHASEKRELQEQIHELRGLSDSLNVQLAQATAELEESRDTLAAVQQRCEELQRLNESEKELNSSLSEEMASLREKISVTEEALRGANDEKQNLLQRVGSLEESVATKTKELDSLQVAASSKDAELNSLRQNAESQQSDLVVQVSELSRDLELKRGEVSLAQAALEEQNGLIAGLKQLIETSSQNLQSLEMSNQVLAAENQEMAQKVDEASKLIEAKEEALEKMTEDCQLLEDSLAEGVRTISQLQESNDELKRSNDAFVQQVEEASRTASELRQKLADEGGVHASLRLQLESSKSETDSLLTRLDEQKTEIHALESRLKEYTESQESLRKEIEVLRHEKQVVSYRLDELNCQSGAAESDLRRSTETVGALRAQLEELQARYDEASREHRAHSEANATALSEKENQLVTLQGQFERLTTEHSKTKEQLALVSLEIENLVAAHDQQLRELLDAESAAKTECSVLKEKLAEKESETLQLAAQLKDQRLENTRAREQVAMFSAEIQNLVQNHDQQLREFADTNVRLEAEVSTYVAKLAECDDQIRRLEARASELDQENTALAERAAQASKEASELCQRHHDEGANLNAEIERLREELQRLHVLRDGHVTAINELQGVERQPLMSEDSSAVQADETQKPERTPVQEETIVPQEAQLLYTEQVESLQREIEALQRDLDAARMDAEVAQALIASKEAEVKSLTEDLESMRNKLEEAERQLNVRSEEARHVQGSPVEPKLDTSQEESKESGDAELKKLKLAFKKSRGELRLKQKILEDRTKEAESLKEKNSSLQAQLEQLTGALASERAMLERSAGDLEERDEQIRQMSSELQSVREHSDLTTQKCESLCKELETAKLDLESLQAETKDARLKCEQSSALTEEIAQLKKQLESSREAFEALSAENEALKVGSTQDGEQLRSELQLAKTELQRLSAEHENAVELSSSRERALQSELDATTELVQQLHSEHAEFSHRKSEEFELLQGQLESLSGDLTRQLELVDSKVEEANALQGKLQASQLQLEKFSAEYSILQDVLLRECGEVPPGNFFLGDEFSAFDYLKWLLGSVRKRREALVSALAEKDQQVASLEESHQSLQRHVREVLKGLTALVTSNTEGTTEPGQPGIATDSEDLEALLHSAQECFLSIKNTNDVLSKEKEQLRSSCEELTKALDEARVENEKWLRKFEAMHETPEKEEQARHFENIIKSDRSLQTDLEDAPLAEKGQMEASSEKEEMLAQIAQLKEEMALLKTQPPTQQCGNGDTLNSELSATKLKSEKMLVKLKLFKDKNDMLAKQLNALRETHTELECSYLKKSGEVGELEVRCSSLQEELRKALVQSERAESLASSLDQAIARADEAEVECSKLRDKVGDLLDQNRKLEIESEHLRSELSSLKEQADMLTSDNEAFQNLAESLKRARQNLEQELKAQHEQHSKALKDIENRYQKQLEEEKSSEAAATAALRRDFVQMQEKYNQILYRHRDLEEEFHVVIEEKKKLEAKCTQLAEDCSAANQALVLMEKQGSVGHKTVQELDLLRQEHQQLQERFHQLKSSQLKAEERLVQSIGQESASLRAKLQEAENTIAELRAAKEQSESEHVQNLRKELDELAMKNAAIVEQSQAKEGRWNQERKQLKHIEEHLKQTAQELSTELEEVRVKHEETLRSKLDLRNRMEQVHKDNRALTQQVQNWRSYIRDFENNQGEESKGHSAEVGRLRMELEQTAQELHRLGLRNEEMSVDLNKVLEEKNSLKQLLAHTQEALRQREAQLLRLQTPPVSRDGSYVIDIENSGHHGASDVTSLQQSRLQETEREKRDLEQRVEQLAQNLQIERQRRHLLEGEMGEIEWGSQSPYRQSPHESQRLLLQDDVIKIPATNYSITRQFMSHASKLRRWFQGRQEASGHNVHHI